MWLRGRIAMRSFADKVLVSLRIKKNNCYSCGSGWTLKQPASPHVNTNHVLGLTVSASFHDASSHPLIFQVIAAIGTYYEGKNSTLYV